MCEIRKPRAEVTVDDGEYTCQLLKCAAPKDEPEDEGCNASPDQFDQYDVLRAKQNNTVHVKVFLSCSSKSNFHSNLTEQFSNNNVLFYQFQILATVTKIQGVTENGGPEKQKLGFMKMITITAIYFGLMQQLFHLSVIVC